MSIGPERASNALGAARNGLATSRNWRGAARNALRLSRNRLGGGCERHLRRRNRVGRASERLVSSRNRLGDAGNRVGEASNRAGAASNRVGGVSNRIGAGSNDPVTGSNDAPHLNNGRNVARVAQPCAAGPAKRRGKGISVGASITIATRGALGFFRGRSPLDCFPLRRPVHDAAVSVNPQTQIEK